MKKIMSWMVFLFVLCSVSAFEQVIVIDLNVTAADGSMTLEKMYVDEDIAYESEEISDYKLILKGSTDVVYYFEPGFYIFHVGEQKTAIEHIQVAMPTKVKTAEFYYKDQLKLIQELNFCNKNNKCDGFESYTSCPQDCPSYAKDNICISSVDGDCDPDCAEGIDPECREDFQAEEGKEAQEKEKKGISGVLVGVIIAVIILVILIIIIKSRKKPEQVTQNQFIQQ